MYNIIPITEIKKAILLNLYFAKKLKIIPLKDITGTGTNAGTKYWYKDGKLHRDDGPAVVNCYGKRWYKNGKVYKVEDSNGDKRWYENGNLHREDGPARETSDSIKHWFMNGVFVKEEYP